MSYAVPRFDGNASRLPSGDQAGRTSGAGAVVNCDARPTAASNTQQVCVGHIRLRLFGRNAIAGRREPRVTGQPSGGDLAAAAGPDDRR